jgi:hypothetical protein
MSLWSPVYVPEIETGRHVKNNAYTATSSAVKVRKTGKSFGMEF